MIKTGTRKSIKVLTCMEMHVVRIKCHSRKGILYGLNIYIYISHWFLNCWPHQIWSNLLTLLNSFPVVIGFWRIGGPTVKDPCQTLLTVALGYTKFSFLRLIVVLNYGESQHTHIFIFIYIYNNIINNNNYIYIYICMYTPTYTHTHTHIYIYTSKYIHIFIHA